MTKKEFYEERLASVSELITTRFKDPAWLQMPKNEENVYNMARICGHWALLLLNPEEGVGGDYIVYQLEAVPDAFRLQWKPVPGNFTWLSEVREVIAERQLNDADAIVINRLTGALVNPFSNDWS